MPQHHADDSRSGHPTLRRAKSGPSRADAARAIVIDPDEPFLTGGSWLSEFPLSYRGDDGAIHVNTQSLQINWEDWRFWIMPNRLRGHTYCHLIAPAHMAALIRGDAQPDER